MSPAHSRWFFAGFAAVLALVTVNALRQPSRVAATAAVVPPPTAPIKAAAKAPEPPAARAPAKADPAPVKLSVVTEPVRSPQRLPSAAMVGQLPLPHVVDGDADLIRRLQKALVDTGYGPLVVTGTAGPLTRAAIMAFEYDHAMALTGEASERVLKRLAAPGGATSSPEADQRRIVTQEAEQVVLIVQKSLQSLGASIAIDGRLGAETEAAVRTFEAGHDLKATGRINAGLFSALGRAMARAKGDAG